MKPASYLSSSDLLDILALSKNATAIYTGDDVVIQMANDAMIAFWGKDRSVVGKPIEEAVPELVGQPFKQMLQDVWRTGITNSGKAIAATLMIDGQLQTFYYDYEYRAIKNAEGQTYAVLHTADDVTANVLNQQQLDVNRQERQQVFDMLPAHILILRGPDFVVESLNDATLTFWNRPADKVIDRPLLEILPELKNQPFPGELRQVLETGITIDKKESVVLFDTPGGKTRRTYVDYIYQPLTDISGNRTGVLVMSFEVTDKVNSRLLLEQYAKELQELNDIAAAANEELTATNEELVQSQEAMQQILDDLAESELRTRSLVESAPFPIAVYMGREMLISMANQSIMDVWGKGNDVIGKTYHNLLPELADQNIYPLLDSVFMTGVAHNARHQQVDLVMDGQLQTFYFNYSFTPLHDTSGQVYGVVNTAADVTDLVTAIQRAEQSERTLHNMILQAPVAMCIMLGAEHVVAVANDLMIELWGKPVEDVMSKPIFEGLPDAREQGLEALLDSVYHNGETFKAFERPVELIRNGHKEIVYQNFVYEPYRDGDGTVLGVIAATVDVTTQVLARHEMEKAITELAASERKFRELIQYAPMGIAIYKGPDMVVDTVNDGMLQIWGKPAEVTGLPLAQALPELESEGQPFLQLIRDVLDSGEIYRGYEAKALLLHNGELKEGYFDFIFQPIKNTEGETESVLQVATDVTQRVQARQELERVEEMLLLAVEAARIGIWQMESTQGILRYNNMMAQILGYEGETEMRFEELTRQMPDESKRIVNRAIEEALSGKKREYDVTYAINRFNDDQQIWVRAMGRVTPDKNGEYTILAGVLIDVTEQKRDELRKNDFIGMVSHELKTPLTSLGAMIQVMHAKLQNSPDTFLSAAAGKAERQVKRMGAMINGFLNVSRLESGKIQVAKTRFDITELLSEVIQETELTTSMHQINFEPCPPIHVDADRDKIGSVVSNLLSNAIKYSPRGKNIDVKCVIENEHVLVSVKDEGMGIKPQDREKLFERYYRVETKHTQHIAGFGIGLYLCLEILQLHNGRIWVDSESGVGSTFYFTLPLRG